MSRAVRRERRAGLGVLLALARGATFRPAAFSAVLLGVPVFAAIVLRAVVGVAGVAFAADLGSGRATRRAPPAMRATDVNGRVAAISALRCRAHRSTSWVTSANARVTDSTAPTPHTSQVRIVFEATAALFRLHLVEWPAAPRVSDSCRPAQVGIPHAVPVGGPFPTANGRSAAIFFMTRLG